MKQCIKCGKWFLPDEVNSKGYCKTCVRDYDWRRRRNITPEQYAHLFNQQNGRCAICGKSYTEESQMFAVDHDHTTKEIRGLLCRNCNCGIGLFGENSENILKAYYYLKGKNMDELIDNLAASINLLSDVIKGCKEEIEKIKTTVDEHSKEIEYIRKSY